MCASIFSIFFFFFNDTATTEIYTLSLHDALPISGTPCRIPWRSIARATPERSRSEEHTSELQSLRHLVCRLLLEKKKARNQRTRSARTKIRRRSQASRSPARRRRRAPISREVSLGQTAGTRSRDRFFFFNDTATTEIYTLSLHDALPI